MKWVLLSVIFSASSCNNNKQSCIDESKIDPGRICTMQYDPVCGCDGKTYGNECEASRAGVTSFTRGECK